MQNYSSIYLTDKRKFSDILNLKGLQTEQKLDLQPFNTSLIDGSNNLYLTLSSVSGVFDGIYYFTLKDQKFVEFTDRIFEIVFINEIDAKIMHRSKDRQNYYLNYQNNDFKFSLSASEDASTFKYILVSFLIYDFKKYCIFYDYSDPENLIYFEIEIDEFISNKLSNFKIHNSKNNLNINREIFNPMNN